MIPLQLFLFSNIIKHRTIFLIIRFDSVDQRGLLLTIKNRKNNKTQVLPNKNIEIMLLDMIPSYLIKKIK